MTYSATDSERARRRVDQALDVLRRALIDYLSALPRASRKAYGSSDLQALLKAFIDQFVELLLPSRARNLAFSVKEARNEVAHYTGVMKPHDALRHLSNVRQLLKDLAAEAAFNEVDRLYGEQLDTLRAPENTHREGAVARVTPRNDAFLAHASKATPATQSAGVAQGKYQALHGHLIGFVDDEWATTFRELEAILGSPLPRSARRHQAWWSNTTTHSHARAWLVAGWRTSDVDIAHETLSFVRSGSGDQGAASRASPEGLIRFDNDDAGYLDWLARNRDGYVVNVRRTLAPDYVVLHRATCVSISTPREPGAYTARSYRKLCGRVLADVRKAPACCGRASASFTKQCSRCNP